MLLEALSRPLENLLFLWQDSAQTASQIGAFLWWRILGEERNQMKPSIPTPNGVRASDGRHSPLLLGSPHLTPPPLEGPCPSCDGAVVPM